MRRSKRDYGRPLGRAAAVPGKQSEGKTFLIVVEGQETEPLYLQGLRKRLQLTSAKVEVLHGRATDPINIVRKAIELRDDRAELTSRSLLVPYDEVWVVFDREAQYHPRSGQLPYALQQANRNEIRVAISNPCFEFWLLLHYCYTTKSFRDADHVIQELAQYVPKYAKERLPIFDLMAKVGQAVEGAARCRKHHRDCAGDGNPSSDVDSLVISLNASAVPSFRCL